MRIIIIIIIIIILLGVCTAIAQPNCGALVHKPQAFDGYTLLFPKSSNDTYLINNCGEIINHWEGSSFPAASAYLLENGNLLRPCEGTRSDRFKLPGGLGGKIEMYNWEGELIWEYFYASEKGILHHDVYPMPNGNILVLSLDKMSYEEVAKLGKDVSLLKNVDEEERLLYNERIMEIQPTGRQGGKIVWEWNVKDHLIQEMNSDKVNFGIVADNPQLLDINYVGLGGSSNWLHFNSIFYNEKNDQIVISSRNLGEVYIIDHSTTTAEAASHTGGNSGKGGDFLYRWGNPAAYQRGDISNQRLFGQHSAYIIPDGFADAGKLMVFNNGIQRKDGLVENYNNYHSSIDVVTLPINEDGTYRINTNKAYEPERADYRIISSEKMDFTSAVVSGAQRLPNGNTLICGGSKGILFEVTSKGELVWHYVNPVSALKILNKSEAIRAGTSVFRTWKYPKDYPAFHNRDVTPQGVIEQHPAISVCKTYHKKKEQKTYNFVSVGYRKYKIETNEPIRKIKMKDENGNKIKASIHNQTLDFSRVTSQVIYLKGKIGQSKFKKKIVLRK